MYKLFIISLFIINVCFASDIFQLKTFNSTGPSVATLTWAKNWDLRKSTDVDDSDALIFSSVANRFLHPGRNVSDNSIYVIRRIASKLFYPFQDFDYELITDQISWSNEQIFLPKFTPGFELSFPSLVGISGRFPTAPRFAFPSVPGKVYLINTTTLPGQIYNISPPETLCEWYYQDFELVDINGDNKLDIVAVRIRDDVCSPLKQVPPFPLKAEFVALIQPEDLTVFPWSLQILYNFENITNRGVVGFFKFVDIDSEIYGKTDHLVPELIYSEFFGKGSFIYYVNKNETWLTPGKTVKRSIIENTLGEMYDILVTDVNGDGKNDFLTTTHIINNTNGVYAYDILGDFRLQDNLTTIRYPLITNLPVYGRPATSARYRAGSLSILEKKNSKKPLIVVGTDGGGQLLLLSPKNNNNKSWEFDNEVLIEFECDILSALIYDINHDGKKDISAPCLTRDAIFSFTTTINDKN